MDLSSRFCALWERIGAKGNPIPVFDDLIKRYREPHRRYHTEAHLAFGLSQLDILADTTLHPHWIEFAFYFHDSVYVIGATDNEEQSARLAIDTLKKAEVTGLAQIHVGAYIMVTKPGQVPSTVGQQVMADIDLAILGQERSVFVEYERQVREEYGSVPEETFWRVRKGILKEFLDRSSIYSTGLFQKLYEERARKNLTWTIASH